MPEVALYLFDGSNLFHAGRFAHRDELVDELASFVAVRGARGVVVFDGVGEDREIGALASASPHMPTRCSSGSRPRAARARRCSSSRPTPPSGERADRRCESAAPRHFLSELAAMSHREDAPSRLADRVDPETRARLERLRRGEGERRLRLPTGLGPG